MNKLSQVGIAVALLGGVVMITGFFPSVIGLEQAAGVGILQILVVLFGFSILTFGAYLFVQMTYYNGIKHNLAQQIGVRLSMTGVVIAFAIGLADVLGYGSHLIGITDDRPVLGFYQTMGMVIGFFIASLGILIFALMGDHPHEEVDLH